MDTCPFIHDKDKVAICKQFLRGACADDKCPLSHSVANKEKKMPVCYHFLRGMCTNDSCPYSHVYVSPEAEVCKDFLKGYCPAGSKCTLRHEYSIQTQHKRKKEPENQESVEGSNVEFAEAKAEAKHEHRQDYCSRSKRRKKNTELPESLLGPIRPDFSMLFASNTNSAQVIIPLA